jgi:hypothetical protein
MGIPLIFAIGLPGNLDEAIRAGIIPIVFISTPLILFFTYFIYLGRSKET